jgi:predicted NodU family carbamoyl transferase
MRDAAAGIVAHGRIIAATEEERFVHNQACHRIAHIRDRFCLKTAGVQLGDLDAVPCRGSTGKLVGAARWLSEP